MTKVKETIAKNSQKNVEQKSLPIQYKVENWETLSDKNRKKFRRQMRTKLTAFKNDILGKDRKPEDVKKAIISFKKFFKANYIAKDLTPEAIYSGNDQTKKAEYIEMVSKINA